HKVSKSNEDNSRKSLGYLRHEFIYYRNKGFDTRSAALCALAAYNGGNTRIRKYIRNGTWDGRNISTIPLKETRDYLKKICRRLETNYQAVL
ncbi:MAG: lytic transglycosylase domain-containing protein, partial [Deltaproteobacteria bacterium]|nr:lytic transglycosylase domain-containing protein [Deltaproteobacteria bacterium]